MLRTFSVDQTEGYFNLLTQYKLKHLLGRKRVSRT